MRHLAITLAVLAAAVPAHAELQVEVYTDGLAHVSDRMEPDPQSPLLSVSLLGAEVDNFVATGQNDTLLTADFTGDIVLINAFGSSAVSINYDVHDLVSKEGRIWTFELNSSTSYTLVMPPGAVIVGMNTIPLSLDTTNERTRLEIPGGESTINYILSGSRQPAEPAGAEPAQNIPDDSGIMPAAAIAGAVGAAAIALLYRKKVFSGRQAAPERAIHQTPPLPEPDNIFARIPDLRDEDREIIRYLCRNGGEASESSIRKKFLQPRTTMWRTIKRLERVGAVDVTKRDSLNIVRVRRGSGEDP